jgi:hypothetical protein
MSKFIAVAKITDPIAVQARCAANGWQAHDGSIFCYVPELGLEGANFVYCRYGLSFPYLRVQVEDRVWIEPTIGDTERWVYTGFVDAADLMPGTTDLLKILLDALGLYKVEFTSTGFIIQINATLKLEYSTSTGITIQDSPTNKIELSSTSIKLTYGSNTIEIGPSNIQINGTNLTVDI